MMTQEIQTHPDAIYDAAAESYKIRATGEYVKKLPDKKRYRFVVEKPCAIERMKFKPGTVLGTGNVALDYNGPVHLFEFEQAEAFAGIAGGIGAGHILPRLRFGLIRAELIED